MFGHPHKPVVLVDMDGPLAGFDERFFEVCHDNGWELHSDVHTQCHRFATDCLVNPDHIKLARKMVEETHWFADLPVTPGCQEGIEALAKVADVWICTKPLEANRNCRDDKAAWIEKHLGYRWLERMILAPNKGMVRGDVLLDDAIKLPWLAYAEWEPVVFPMPWNGEGTDWAEFRRWSWDQPIEDLLP